MTKKIDFEGKWDQLVELIEISHKGKIPDVALMSELEFNPSSWKVWKPKFVEQASVAFIYKHDDQYNITSSSFVEYQKKKKLWSIKKCDDNQIRGRMEKIYS